MAGDSKPGFNNAREKFWAVVCGCWMVLGLAMLFGAVPLRPQIYLVGIQAVIVGIAVHVVYINFIRPGVVR